MTTRLEHLNITVSDPDRTAEILNDIFGWVVRWDGKSQLGGRSVHVGEPETGGSYLAIYRAGDVAKGEGSTYATIGGLNHLGITVADLDAVEQRVVAAGFEPYSHDDYEPGRRFYFDDHDGIEYEVVSYS